MSFDERRWAANIRAGDRQAFELLYKRCAGRVAGFVLRMAVDRSECEDIVQEVFMAAFTSRKSFSGRSKPPAWLLGIAVRRCRDRSRRGSLSMSVGCEVDEIRAHSMSPERSLEDHVVEAISVVDALAHLKPQFREALLLVASQ